MKRSAIVYILISAFGLMMITVQPAFAGVNFTFDEAQFLTENLSLVKQDFLSTFVAPGDNILCESPVNSQSDDNCFSPGDILPGIEITGTLLRLLGADFSNNGNPPNPLIISETGLVFDILFAPGVNAAGIKAGCVDPQVPCSESARVLVFGESGQIGETVIPISGSFNTFLGITASEPIVNVRLQDEVEGIPTDLGVLYVLFRAERNIPTLSEWGMIGAAAGSMLIGVFFAVRRRKTGIVKI